jgi:pyruvate carboxylase subunit B
MKLFVDVAAANLGEPRSFEIDLEPLGSGRYRVTAGGRTREVDVLDARGQDLALLADGRAVRYSFEVAHGLMKATDGLDVFEIRLADERTHVAERLLGHRGEARGAHEVRAIMPGIVSRVLVAEGAAVEAGAPLLIVEAMKMENEIRAESRGVVSKLHVKPGTTVNAGEVLLELGPPPAESPPGE